jgi:integrase
MVFHSQTGKKLRDREVLKTLQEQVIAPLCEEFPTPINEKGFANGTVHGFRHYFCSEAYRNGARDAELLEWLGHRDSEIMKQYCHLRAEDGQERMSQINFLDLDPKPEHRDNDVA